MTSPGHFLCGCSPISKRGYSGDTVKSAIPGADPVYTDKRYDDAGFEVCPEHGERLYGYASVPTVGPRPDFRAKGTGALKGLDFEHVEDKRDNRDPEEVYMERQREKAQMSNGHA